MTVAVSGANSPPPKTQAPASFISAVSALTFRMIGSRNSGGGGGPSGW